MFVNIETVCSVFHKERGGETISLYQDFLYNFLTTYKNY